VKEEKKSQTMCGQFVKTIFWKFEKSPWEHYISNICIYIHIYIFAINTYTFKVATTQFLWKFTMFQDSFYMFKALKKNMWTCGFLYQKLFSLIKCSSNCFNFFVNFNIFHKKGSMYSKHSNNKNTYTFLDFNTQMSF
jgi:hypothetical protein